MNRCLDQDADLATRAGESPPSVYWCTEPFFPVRIGLAHLDARHYRQAADMIAAGLDVMPCGHREAEWVTGYEKALALAQEQA